MKSSSVVVLFVSVAAVLDGGGGGGVEAYSSFLGRSMMGVSSTSTSSSPPPPRRAWMEMKKGKPNVPPQMRSQYQRQQEMAEYRQEMAQATNPADDGMPVFNLYVRAGVQSMWYPCGTFQGDEKAKTLASSYRDGGLLSGTSKTQLDRGISGSLYSQKEKLIQAIVQSYPFLKKQVGKFEFGYKLAFQGLSEQEVTPVKVEQQKGFLDSVKGIFGQ